MATEHFVKSCEIATKNVRVALTSDCNLQCSYCDGPLSRSDEKPGAMEDFRKKPLSEGFISTADYVRIFESLHRAGFSGINFTGGEPMLNRDWDVLVQEANRIGFDRVEMTTNGILLVSYLKKHGKFPDGLTQLKVSLDTHDPDKFKAITKVGSLDRLARGVHRLRETNPDITLRANKVLLRSDMPELPQYIDYIHELGMDGMIFLDLVLTELDDLTERASYEKEYVFIEEAVDILKKMYGDDLVFDDHRYGYRVILPNGLFVVLKDSDGLTLRDTGCEECEMYCQEGLFTARVSTDGSISPCLDRHGRLDYIDSMAILDEDALDAQTSALFQRLVQAEPTDSFPEFLRRSGAEVKRYRS
jgi:molybdenum cofactor biosynthesis enzyme MoaA